MKCVSGHTATIRNQVHVDSPLSLYLRSRSVFNITHDINFNYFEFN